MPATVVQVMYCWRCQAELPTLDEDEFAWVMEHVLAYPSFAGWSESEKQELVDYAIAREQDGVDVATAMKQRVFDGAVARWEQLTGLADWDFAQVWHHRGKLYGPPCKTCGSPLRTPQAKRCADCGEPA